jgi:hypothetical protein
MRFASSCLFRKLLTFGSLLGVLAGFLPALSAAPSVSWTSPARVIANPGQTVTLSAVATGSGSVSYRWLHKGRPIEGATAATLTVNPVSYASAGWYTVDVTDTTGTTRSAPRFVLVTPANGTQLTAWGINDYGQSTTPTTLTDIVSFSAAESNGLAVRSNGTITGWGSDALYYLPYIEISDVVAVAAGGFRYLALKSDGTVMEWGRGVDSFSAVPNLQNAVAVATGGNFAMALKADGKVTAWGISNTGQLAVPSDLVDVVAIGATQFEAMALKADGTLVKWSNDPTYYNLSPPGPLPPLSDIKLSLSTVLALKKDGGVIGWPSNVSGTANVPAGLSDATAATPGVTHSLVLRSDGTMVAWGNNDYGQCAVPAAGERVLAIGAGRNYSAALLERNPGWVAPTITVQPVSRTLALNEGVTFSVAATGAPTVLYQWRKNGISIPGANQSYYTVPFATRGRRELFCGGVEQRGQRHQPRRRPEPAHAERQHVDHHHPHRTVSPRAGGQLGHEQDIRPQFLGLHTLPDPYHGGHRRSHQHAGVRRRGDPASAHRRESGHQPDLCR